MFRLHVTLTLAACMLQVDAFGPSAADADITRFLLGEDKSADEGGSSSSDSDSDSDYFSCNESDEECGGGNGEGSDVSAASQDASVSDGTQDAFRVEVIMIDDAQDQVQITHEPSEADGSSTLSLLEVDASSEYRIARQLAKYAVKQPDGRDVVLVRKESSGLFQALADSCTAVQACRPAGRRLIGSSEVREMVISFVERNKKEIDAFLFVNGVISTIHHRLRDAPLPDIYPYLAKLEQLQGEMRTMYDKKH